MKTRPFRSRKSLDYRKGTTQGIPRLFEMPKRREQRTRLLRQQKRRNELMEASRLHVGVTCHVPHWTWSEITNRLLSHECCSATFPDFQIDFFDPIDIMASPYHRQSPGKSVCQCNCRVEFKAPHYCNVNRLWHMVFKRTLGSVKGPEKTGPPSRPFSFNFSPLTTPSHQWQKAPCNFWSRQALVLLRFPFVSALKIVQHLLNFIL